MVLHRGGPPIPNVVRLVPPPPEPPEVRPHFDDVDAVIRDLYYLLDDAIPFERMWRVSEARHLEFYAWLYAHGGFDGVSLVVEPSEDGFIAYDDDIRVIAEGDTEEDARANFEDARQHLAKYLKDEEA